MGGFASVLGAGVGGFEQAHQQDLQRQFLGEMANRQAGLDIFKTVALDPNQHPDVRSAALEGYLGIVNTPAGKQFKLDKATAPMQQIMARVQAQKMAAQNQPPPPPMQMQTPGMTMGSPAQVTPGQPIPLPPGIAGPPQMGAPQITGGQASLPPTNTSVQGPPPPPPELQGVLAGFPEIAKNVGTLAGEQSGGALAGQLAVHRQVAQQLLNDPQYADFIKQNPMLQSMLISSQAGINVPFGAMFRNIGTGGGYAGDLRKQGAQIDPNIPDTQWVNERQTPSGATFTPGPAPGEKEITQGTLGGTEAQTTARQQAELPFWQKKNQIQFGQRQALLNQEFALGVQRGVYADANKAFVDSVKDYGAANKTMQSMDEAYRAVQANPNNQQAQVALLMSHIGMTLGVVKGARVGKAQIEEAEDSRTMFAGAASKLNFDKDGNLDWSDPIRKGVTLTPDQMKQMVDLGHQRMQILHDNIGTMHDQLDPNSMQTPYITPTPMRGAGAGKGKGASAGGPPPPPTGRTGAHQSFSDWKKSQAKGAGQ